MARSKITRQRPDIVNDVERADISIPAPGMRFHVLNKDPKSDNDSVRVNMTRQKQAAIYYEMFTKHPTIRSGVEKISKTAVSTGYTFVPADVWDDKTDLEDGRRKELVRFARASHLRQLLRTTFKDLIIFGDAYWWIGKKKNGQPDKAKRLHPAFVEIKTNGPDVSGYLYGSPTDPDKRTKYRPDQVVHFKLDDPNSDLYGLSLLSSLETTVASDLFAMTFNGKFFENSAQTGIIFALKSTDAAEIERNREYLKQEYVGSENAHKPLLLEGDVDVKPSVSKMSDMQFIEGRRFNRTEILSVLDVPPEKIGIVEDSNRSTSKEADVTFREEAISPLQGVVEDEINDTLILGMYGWDDVLFKHNEVSSRDNLDQMKLLAEAERMGILSPNYIRKTHFGLAGVEGGDQHFIQTAAGLIPLLWVDDVARRLLTDPSAIEDLKPISPTSEARNRAEPETLLDEPEDIE